MHSKRENTDKGWHLQMNVEVLKELAYEKIGKVKAHIEREPGHIYYHGLRTAKLALNLRRAVLPKDDSHDDIIFTAGLFHDIGKGIEPHSETGFAIVNHILKDFCTSDELEKVSYIVRMHFRRVIPNDYPFWLRIIQDADILDHMGTTEIWLTFLYSAFEQRSIDRSIEWYKRDEYKKNIIHLRKLLNYEESKLIWDEKVEFVDNFVCRLQKESEGEIPK